jgi:hypothetical protein
LADFTIHIAGHSAAVSSLFDSTKDYCRDYWTSDQGEFHIRVTEADLRLEQQLYDEEAREEGFRLRVFSDPFLDRSVIQRKLADRLFRENVLMLHGSAIAVDGQGFLFTAKSGTGKSTHTRLWREAFGSRAQMINDDKPFLSLRQQILICGAPWSGKHGLHSNITVPLQGICILERGNENRIAPISSSQALPMLLRQTHCPPGGQSQLRLLLECLSGRVQLWHMTCTKDLDAATVAHSAMTAGSPDPTA